MLSSRVLILAWVFVLLFAGAIARLFELQVLRRHEFQIRAQSRGRKEIELPALRGAILSREGLPLAQDVESGVVSIFPSVFRERSLVFAVRDLLWLTRDETDTRSTAAFLADVRARPGEAASLLLARPSAHFAVDASEWSRRGEGLIFPSGELLRGSADLEARVRSALEIAAGDSRRIRRRDLQTLGRRDDHLGAALDLESSELSLRLLTELRLLRELGSALGQEDEVATDVVLGEIMAREESWVLERLELELRDAAALDRLGTAQLDRLFDSGEELAKFAERVGATIEDPIQAEAALLADAALQSGALPPSLSRAALEEASSGHDSVGEAVRRGLFSADPERLRAAWWEGERRRPEFDSDAHLGPRRRRELLARYRGGRSFRFGGRAQAEVAPLIVGPGRLEELGFRLSPAFRRDEAVRLALPTSLQLLVGDVAPETGVPRAGFGLEHANHRTLQGTPGVSTASETSALRAPEHGATLRTTLSVPLTTALEAVLRAAAFDDPAAIAVVEVATGDVLGAATWPLPADPAEALRERDERDDEMRWLKTWIRRGSGAATQRLLSLREASHASAEEARERDFLAFALERPESWNVQRLLDLQKAQARSGAFHRAADSSEHFPPGSVFKALTILAGLEAGVIDPHFSIDCLDTKRRPYHRCHNHGAGIGVTEALERSCNEFCYEIGERLGADRQVEFQAKLSLFEPVPGLLPAERERIPALLKDPPKSLAIGGGSVFCTPVRAAGLAASLASGRVVRPRLVVDAASTESSRVTFATAAHLDLIRRGMRAVVGPRGTAARHAAALAPFRIAAKTGTADYGGADDAGLQQAWFVGFAPADPGDTPKWAFAIVRTHTTRQGADVAGLAEGVLRALGLVYPEDMWW